MPLPKCVPNYKDAVWSYYRYEPSIEAAAIFAALFGITTILHGVQMFKSRTWYLIALLCGGICETIGYIGRVLNATQDPGCWTMGPFIMQSLLILIAPAFMAASIYMILGRIITLTEGESHVLIKRQWLTKIFVLGDVASLLLQGSGGGMMAAGEKMLDAGEKIIVVGLFVQLVFFGCFIVVSAHFHWRMAAAPTAAASNPRIRWKLYLVTLYVTSLLIWTRSIFRVIEYLQGNDGPLMSTEVYVFVFDGALMLCVLAWMNWFHPSEIGLLLRGDAPIKNGLELVKVGRGGHARVQSATAESLSTENGPMASTRSFA